MDGKPRAANAMNGWLQVLAHRSIYRPEQALLYPGAGIVQLV